MKQKKELQPQLPKADVSGWQAFEKQKPSIGDLVCIDFKDGSAPALRKVYSDDNVDSWGAMWPNAHWFKIPACH